MNHPEVKSIDVAEKSMDTQLYIFHQEIVKALINLNPVNVTDDFLLKWNEVQIALEALIEKRPDWFYKAQHRGGTA
jgi:hypothetical protein